MTHRYSPGFEPFLLSLALCSCTQAAHHDGPVLATSSEVATPSGPEPEPGSVPITADPNASAQARSVLGELYAAPARADRRLIIGQELRAFDFDQPVDQPVTALTSQGLPAPKLLELELTEFGITDSHDEELYQMLAGHAALGGLIGFTFHASNPFTGGGVYDRTDVRLVELADPAQPTTAAGVAWQQTLDQAAGVLQKIEATGAVVFFRPLHESNGGWFWWGQSEPSEFRSTWLGMLSYLTLQKGIHNMLWVYSANRNFGGIDPTVLYPGDDVVDVTGLDIYDDNLSDSVPGEPGYGALVALGKPFGLTEYGAEHNGASELPNDEVLAHIKQQYPATVLANAWYSLNGDDWQMSDKPEAASLLLDAWSITR